MHTRDLIQFLAELSENNNRAWFVMNKPRYDILRAEFLELVTGLIPQIVKFDPAVAGCNPKKALFRINRDMRFSHDKSPYKSTFSAAITASGLKKPSQGGGPAYYFHIDAQGTLLVAGGEYMPPSDRLKTIRQHVIADAAGFRRMLRNKRLQETYGDLQDEGKLTRPPKGFDADAPNIEYVKHKSFIVWKETSLKKKIPADLGKELAAGFKDAYPLVAWLREAK
ncbi:DUF2461 domain-containing protein [Noviherbaspirillum sp. Root189]|uniref:DUF2461 domain-containing protein n=1 Tax=Noviherbaspirillum sp. Root189 TaxID=1736487 RepID=UPI000708D783|nr:DUF2461 domain-containing protein [Noviherbaspirillum sp. Root189]KRB92751.1 hypothetical protein ASE07_15420 [Noviherbaspirillum sp. Root189]